MWDFRSDYVGIINWPDATDLLSRIFTEEQFKHANIVEFDSVIDYVNRVIMTLGKGMSHPYFLLINGGRDPGNDLNFILSNYSGNKILDTNLRLADERFGRCFPLAIQKSCVGTSCNYLDGLIAKIETQGELNRELIKFGRSFEQKRSRLIEYFNKKEAEKFGLEEKQPIISIEQNEVPTKVWKGATLEGLPIWEIKENGDSYEGLIVDMDEKAS